MAGLRDGVKPVNGRKWSAFVGAATAALLFLSPTFWLVVFVAGLGYFGARHAKV